MLKIFKERKTLCSCFESPISSSFIQTILLVLELHQIMRFYARGLYRQSGISPCPEDTSIQLFLSNIPLISNICNSSRRFRKYFGSDKPYKPVVRAFCVISITSSILCGRNRCAQSNQHLSTFSAVQPPFFG